MINYLSKFLCTEVPVLLKILSPLKAKWSWNGIYQNLYVTAKKLILHLEMDASGIGLGAWG